MKVTKKILFGLSILLLLASLIISSILYSEKWYRNIVYSFFPMYTQGATVRMLTKNPNLTIDDVQNTLKTAKAYNGFQYSHTTLEAEVILRGKNTASKVVFVSDDIIRYNKTWQVAKGEDLSAGADPLPDGVVPILVSGNKHNKSQIGDLLDIKITGENGAGLVVKGKIIGKIFADNIGFSIPEYETKTASDLSSYLDATIVLKDKGAYSQLFAERDKRILVFYNQQASKEDKTLFLNKLSTCGAVETDITGASNVSSAYVYSELPYLFYNTMAIAAIVAIIAATLLMCGLSNLCIKTSLLWKILSPLIGFITAFGISVALIPVFVKTTAFMVVIKGNLLMLLSPLLIIIINAIIQAVFLRSKNNKVTVGKQGKEVLYEKI